MQCASGGCCCSAGAELNAHSELMNSKAGVGLLAVRGAVRGACSTVRACGLKLCMHVRACLQPLRTSTAVRPNTPGIIS